MTRLRDVVVDRARVLFVGINPSTTSGRVGHHFASPGNPFWRLVYDAGFTREPLVAERDRELARDGCALVNLCSRPTRAASELTRAEIARGRTRLYAKVRRMRPHVVALVGVTLYPIVLGPAAAKGHPGPGEKPQRLAGARVFVVPNPSGLNASFPGYDDKLVWFRALHAFADQGE